MFLVDRNSSRSDALAVEREPTQPSTRQPTQPGSSNLPVSTCTEITESDSAVELTLTDSADPVDAIDGDNAVDTQQALQLQSQAKADIGPDMSEFSNLLSKDNPTDMGQFNADIDDKLKQFIVDFGISSTAGYTCIQVRNRQTVVCQGPRASDCGSRSFMLR